MPDDRSQLIAYLATLAALATIFITALIAAAIAPALLGKLEVFGLGTITGGLIGVLRMPTRQAPAANVEQAGTVNQAPTSSPAA